MVHVYTGDGKGKTTAALGLALRILGWGGRVCVVQFIKGYPEIGEAKFAAQLGERFVLRQFARDDSLAMDEGKALLRREEARAALEFARATIAEADYDLVILDEINNALHYGLLDLAHVIEMLESRPGGVEVVLTGRQAPAEVLAAADYVTEMRMIEHPFGSGHTARKGIDY